MCLRAPTESPPTVVSPAPPKNDRNGEANDCSGGSDIDAKREITTGYGDLLDAEKQLCFTTWYHRAVTRRGGRKILYRKELSHTQAD